MAQHIERLLAQYDPRTPRVGLGLGGEVNWASGDVPHDQYGVLAKFALRKAHSWPIMVPRVLRALGRMSSLASCPWGFPSLRSAASARRPGMPMVTVSPTL
jgi:hypothetical protein